jgi:hypothetical protein
MRSTLVKVATLIGAGLLVLSGCSTAGDPNTAATVNGQVLSEARVTELSQAISDTYLATWEAQQEAGEPAASRTPEQQAAYETSLAQQQVKMAPGKYRLAVVGVTIQGQLARETAKAIGLTVTDDQRKQVIAQDSGLAALSANPVTKDFIDSLADAQVVFSDANGAQAGKAAAAKAAVQLNPRYGTWDPSQIAPSGSGSLSVTLKSSGQ